MVPHILAASYIVATADRWAHTLAFIIEDLCSMDAILWIPYCGYHTKGRKVAANPELFWDFPRFILLGTATILRAD